MQYTNQMMHLLNVIHDIASLALYLTDPTANESVAVKDLQRIRMFHSHFSNHQHAVLPAESDSESESDMSNIYHIHVRVALEAIF